VTTALEPGSAGEALEPAARPKKKTKAADPGEIRDRNQRIREEAAAKRRAKRETEERRAAPARNLETGEIVDDALARSSHAVATFLKRNFALVQWLIVAAVVGGIGYQIYSYRRGLSRDRATAEIARAVVNEQGRIGDAAKPAPDQFTGLSDPRPAFADEAQRLKAAEKEYRKAKDATSGTVSALATLGLAGILFDQGKYAEAKTAYEQVKDSELAARDRDARARAIEGIGLSLEALGQLEPALRAFRELENLDIPGIGALGQYQQARVLLRQNEREKAKELLKKAHAKLKKSEKKEETMLAAAPSGYLESQVRELLASLDPEAVPKAMPEGITAEQLERLKQQLQLQSPKLPMPMPAPAPAPMGSAP